MASRPELWVYWLQPNVGKFECLACKVEASIGYGRLADPDTFIQLCQKCLWEQYPLFVLERIVPGAE